MSERFGLAIYFVLVVIVVILSLASTNLENFFFGSEGLHYVPLGMYSMIFLVGGTFIGWIVGIIKAK